MIMPCIKSTSACDRWGTVGRVEGGSVLLGSPGAPGWTTTEVAAGTSLCACAAGNSRKRSGDSSTPSISPDTLANVIRTPLLVRGRRYGQLQDLTSADRSLFKIPRCSKCYKLDPGCSKAYPIHASPSYRCRWQIHAFRVVPIASSIGSILIPLPSALVVIDG